MTTTIKTPKAPLTPVALVKQCIKRASRKGEALDALIFATNAGVNAEADGGVTGTWRFQNGVHVIRLGTRFVEAMKPNALGARSQSGRDKAATLFGIQILRHEAWHGRVTVRDLDAIAANCKARSIPFLLVNLMEDMRLEHLAREAEKVKFEWHQFMPYNRATNPLHALANMVTYETEICFTFTDHTHPNHSTHAKDWKEKVEDFARRIKTAATTWAVIDLAQEWLEYWNAQGWGRSTQTVPRGTMAGDAIGGDSDGSATAMSDKRTTSPVHTVSSNSSNTSTVSVRLPKRVPFTRFRTYTGAQAIDPREADAIAAEMRTIIARTASQYSVRTSSSGSRLHIAGIASRSEQVFRNYGKTGGKPHLVMLMDFSGSMSRDWQSHGRLFTAALLRLLRSGDITGKLYGTGGGMLGELPATLSDTELAGLCPHLQGENIRDSLTALQSEVQGANAVLIYTDGELMDGHVDAGEWRRKGVDLVGSVVIPANKSEDFRRDKLAMMTRHFGAPVTAEHGKALARKLAQYLGARWR
jgi:hypothetical protein